MVIYGIDTRHSYFRSRPSQGNMFKGGALTGGEWFFIIPKLHSNIIILLD